MFMKIIEDLIDELSTPNSRLTDVLIKAKVLAHKLKSVELKEWVDLELNGYTKKNVPEYRIVPCEVIGTLNSGFHMVQNCPLSVSHLKEEHIKALKHCVLTQSISSLEDAVRSAPTGKMGMIIPPEVYGALSAAYDDCQVEYAKQQMSVASVSDVLTKIKSNLLDFLLALNDSAPEEKDIDKLTDSAGKDEVKTLFTSTVYGNNNTIVVGDHNKVSVKIVSKGDFKSLADYLASKGIPEKEITELKGIIDKDDRIDDSKKIGSKVSTWIGKIVAMAASKSIDIGVSAAGELLASGIEQYYGWL